MGGLGRIELPTSCTQSKHHTPRPKSLAKFNSFSCFMFFQWSAITQMDPYQTRWHHHLCPFHDRCCHHDATDHRSV